MKPYFSYSDENFFIHYHCDTQPQKKKFSLHTHNQYELYWFLGGKGNFKIEGNTYALKAGDILIMQPVESHYIDIEPSQPYTRLTIHFNREWLESIVPESRLLTPFTNRQPGQMNLYRSADFRNHDYQIYLHNLQNASKHSRTETIIYLLPLLNEIAIAFDNREKEKIGDAIILDILRFINDHIAQNLSLECLCDTFFISKPHLCRLFKEAVGTTVWNYITAKRIYLAREMICSGIAPTKACTDCGFGDYSAFYRAYKKEYGTSPSR